MTNSSDVPQPPQPGAEPPAVPQPGTQPPAVPQPGMQPPAGNIPPAGYEPPQGYPAPGQAYPPSGQAYPQPGQPYSQPGGFHFEMPTDGPHNFNDLLPKAGLAGMFSVTGLPTELKVSYWIWLIGGMLGVLGGLLGLLGTLALFAVSPALAAVVLLLVLVALVLGAAQVVLVLKMKEGKEWARLVLTIVAGVSLVLAVLGGSMGQGIGNNWFGFLISAAATVLMWLPNSQAWFNAVKGRA